MWYIQYCVECAALVLLRQGLKDIFAEEETMFLVYSAAFVYSPFPSKSSDDNLSFHRLFY